MMMACQIELRMAGKPYPRTCPTCGLFGKCSKGLDHETLYKEATANTTEAAPTGAMTDDEIVEAAIPNGYKTSWESVARNAIRLTRASDRAAMQAPPRRTFPILKGEGAKIDYQLVADHAEQARANHYQSVDRLAERGGLSWCELYAVLHNRKWEKMDSNEAMIACRALEARYLAALKGVRHE